MSSRPKRRGARTGRRDWLWVLAFVVIVVVGLFGAFLLLAGGSTSNVIATVDGVECQRNEQLNYHVHSHLDIIIEGQPVEVPTNLGIRTDCLFWLHTHSPNGILHVEAPAKRDFTLGQFFAVWGQPLSTTQLLDRTADASHQIQATVNGESWSGNPADIPLNDKTSIVLEYGPPFVTPPVFDWGQ